MNKVEFEKALGLGIDVRYTDMPYLNSYRTSEGLVCNVGETMLARLSVSQVRDFGDRMRRVPSIIVEEI